MTAVATHLPAFAPDRLRGGQLLAERPAVAILGLRQQWDDMVSDLGVPDWGGERIKPHPAIEGCSPGTDDADDVRCIPREEDADGGAVDRSGHVPPSPPAVTHDQHAGRDDDRARWIDLGGDLRSVREVGAEVEMPLRWNPQPHVAIDADSGNWLIVVIGDDVRHFWKDVESIEHALFRQGSAAIQSFFHDIDLMPQPECIIDFACCARDFELNCHDFLVRNRWIYVGFGCVMRILCSAGWIILRPDGIRFAFGPIRQIGAPEHIPAAERPPCRELPSRTLMCLSTASIHVKVSEIFTERPDLKRF